MNPQAGSVGSDSPAGNAQTDPKDGVCSVAIGTWLLMHPHVGA